jgi:hypothetical protein
MDTYGLTANCRPDGGRRFLMQDKFIRNECIMGLSLQRIGYADPDADSFPTGLIDISETKKNGSDTLIEQVKDLLNTDTPVVAARSEAIS